MNPTLVVMAAGLGSRFGGTKQLAEVGPAGEAFLDFAITDAVAVGVTRVVLVVRTEIEADVRRHVDRQHRHRGAEIVYVRQDTHGPARPKPWGTAHAVLVAAAEVDGPFIVCNADDYYGASTFESMAESVANVNPNWALLAGFRLDQTLPAVGEVSRGICQVADGRLTSIVEHHQIARRDDGSITAGDPDAVLADDSVASMNFWVFDPSFFDHLDSKFGLFLAANGDQSDAEYLLPSVVAELMASDELSVGVVPTTESWIGVTNPADLEIARNRIAEMRSHKQ